MTNPVTAQSPSTARGHTRSRSVILGTLGNVMEWYDFTIYGFLAAAISANFFPSNDPTAALLSTFAIFGVGFVARPIGALVLGPIADQRGRKFVMLISMLLMALGSLIIGMSPTYATIGAAAPACILLGRLLQGFSAGGEFGSAAVYLTEWASPGRRGFFGSFHQVGAYGGLLLGLTVVGIMTSALGSAAVNEWAWRLPFLIGALLALVVLLLRRNVGETPEFQDLEKARLAGEGTPVTEAPSGQQASIVKRFFLAVGIGALWSVTSYVTISFMPTFATAFTKVPSAAALWATGLGCLVAVVLIPVAGNLSDRIGRRPLLLAASVSFIILPAPLLWFVISVPSFWSLLVTEVLFAVPAAAIAGVGIAATSELFGTHNRGRMVSIGPAIAVTVFGGFGPYISTWLISSTKLTIAPAFYIMAVAIITLITALNLPKGNREDTSDTPPVSAVDELGEAAKS